MTDANLLVFGCLVTFIAVAGAYVYIRESLTVEERPAEIAPRRRPRPNSRLRDVA